jgi:hypothetical protein
MPSHPSYNPVTSVRIAADLAIEIQQAVDAYNATHSGHPWNRTDFLMLAAREKLRRDKRRLGTLPPRPPPIPDVIVEEEQHTLTPDVQEGATP